VNLKERRRALDFGALYLRGRFKTASLDADGTCEEAPAFLHLLGVEILDRAGVVGATSSPWECRSPAHVLAHVLHLSVMSDVERSATRGSF
jgi:hypothetical protein